MRFEIFSHMFHLNFQLILSQYQCKCSLIESSSEEQTIDVKYKETD